MFSFSSQGLVAFPVQERFLKKPNAKLQTTGALNRINIFEHPFPPLVFSKNPPKFEPARTDRKMRGQKISPVSSASSRRHNSGSCIRRREGNDCTKFLYWGYRDKKKPKSQKNMGKSHFSLIFLGAGCATDEKLSCGTVPIGCKCTKIVLNVVR